MLTALSRAWWVFLVRGIAAVVLGLSLWFQPAASLAVLVVFFGAWMLVDGIFTAIGAIAGRKENDEWGWMLVSGILSAILGALTLHAPGITAVVLVLYVAAWAIMAGISQIALGWRIRKEVSGAWWFYLAGAAALLLGLSILWDPGAGALSIAWMLAFFAVLFGIGLIALSLRLKSAGGRLKQ
jgi:uncharacterized membrane protein HdeD (DUF308 family)